MSQPAKVLLLYAHPESQDSVANRVLLKPATQLSNVTVHDLYAQETNWRESTGVA